jgi:hypothetical protein
MIGTVFIIIGSESVDPAPFVAVTITPYLVPRLNPVNVAVTAVAEIVAFGVNGLPVKESLKE